MYVVIEVDNPREELDSGIAHSIWNVLIENAPYDTGNLRSSIRLAKDSGKRLLYVYDENQARYLDFLERGVGPVKKYKGFISKTSLNWSTIELVSWLKGNKPTNTNVPVVVLRGRVRGKKTINTGNGKPIGYEKKYIKNKGTQLTAKERSMMSKLYVKEGFGKLFRYTGERVETTLMAGTSKTATNIKKGT